MTKFSFESENETENRYCKNKPKHKLTIDGFMDFQVCTRHLADEHLQHLITMKIARVERVENLKGHCAFNVKTKISEIGPTID